MVDRRHRAALAVLIETGQATQAEIAAALGVARQSVARWVHPAAAAEARRQIVSGLVAKAMKPPPEDRSTPYEEGRPMPRIVAQKNPDRATMLSKINRGKMTPRQAAARYGVPVSGVIGWMKLAGLEIPEEYAQPRRKPREP